MKNIEFREEDWPVIGCGAGISSGEYPWSKIGGGSSNINLIGND